jgi:hypothetical protein
MEGRRDQVRQHGGWCRAAANFVNSGVDCAISAFDVRV